MKLLFFSNTLKGGGAERVLLNITKELARRGYDITIALNHNDSNYEIASNINIVGAPAKDWYRGKNVFRRFVRNIKVNRSYSRFTRDTINIEHPDVIITFLGCNMKAIIKYHGAIPIIHSEHNAYDRQLGLIKYINRFYLNKKFDKVFVLTPFDHGYASAKGLKNTIVMPNPNTFESISEDQYRTIFSQRKNILLCGRVNQWYIKGFDIAIEAFASISEELPDVDLDIVGAYDNVSKDYLYKLAEAKGVAERVHFFGYRSDIQDLMLWHQVFVLSSRTEGFPMVITEAMTQGLPCLAFERLASSIIIDGKDGFLVENGDIQSLSNNILKILQDDNIRYNIGLEATRNVSRFSSSVVAEKWERVFQQLVTNY